MKDDDVNGKLLYNFLAEHEQPEKTDLIVALGHFDLRIPQLAVHLFIEGFAPLLVLSGGTGAGSAGFNKPEADVFLDTIKKLYPGIDLTNIIVENKSTNTAENLRFTQDLLYRRNPEFTFLQGIDNVALITTPSRMLRARLTAGKVFPEINYRSIPPDSDYDTDKKLYEENGQNFFIQLLGEIERLKQYPSLNYIDSYIIPDEVETAYANLKASQF